MNARHLTIRNVPEEVAAALEREHRRRGTSLNQTVIDLLRENLGLAKAPSNGLHRFAGTWTETEHRKFLSRIHRLESIDAELWK